ncbi:MAG TPA: hypothetical protein VFD43_10930 [Planctomycetota bacterium]|nr:hypothetical protein [Planctomycetota bacterium]
MPDAPAENPRAGEPRIEAVIVRGDEGPPFGPAFFLEQLRGLIRDRCPSPAEGLPGVELRLVDGETLDLCHVIAVAPSWVVLAVNERDRASTAPRMRTELVPFATIIRVTIRTARDEAHRIGFDASQRPLVIDQPAGQITTAEAALRAVRGEGG